MYTTLCLDSTGGCSLSLGISPVAHLSLSLWTVVFLPLNTVVFLPLDGGLSPFVHGLGSISLESLTGALTVSAPSHNLSLCVSAVVLSFQGANNNVTSRIQFINTHLHKLLLTHRTKRVSLSNLKRFTSNSLSKDSSVGDRVEDESPSTNSPGEPVVRSSMWNWRGYSIRYQYCGNSGPALVLIHGFGANSDHWRKNIPVLAKFNRVFTIDLIGYGYSDKPNPQELRDKPFYTFETWAAQPIWVDADIWFERQQQEQEIYAGSTKRSLPDSGILISGCQTDQTSADASSSGNSAEAYGALNNAIQTILAENNVEVSNRELVTNAGEMLKSQGFIQRPGCCDDHVHVNFVC